LPVNPDVQGINGKVEYARNGVRRTLRLLPLGLPDN
jgi:hypothetical protein